MNQNRYSPPNSPVADVPAQNIQSTEPSLLRFATRILWASLGIGLVNTPLEWTFLTSTAPTSMVIGILTFTFVVIALLTHYIGRGRNWARIVLLILAIIGLPSLAQLPITFARAPFSGVINVLQTLLQFAALYIVFVTSARHAFSKRNNAQQSVQTDRA
jgi:hypothetical protein